MAKQTKPAAPAVSAAILKKLKGMRDRWDKQKKQSKVGGGTTLPEDRYISKLTGARLVEGNNKLSVVFTFTVVEGDHTGETAERWCGLETDDKIMYLQRDMRRMGVDVDELDLDQLPDQLKELLEVAPTVRLTVKQNGEYTNVYIDKLVDMEDAPDGGDDAGDGEPSGDDDTDPDAEPDADAEEPEPEIPVKGHKYRYEDGGKKYVGEATKVDAKKQTVTLKLKSGKTVTKDFDDVEEMAA